MNFKSQQQYPETVSLDLDPLLHSGVVVVMAGGAGGDNVRAVSFCAGDEAAAWSSRDCCSTHCPSFLALSSFPSDLCSPRMVALVAMVGGDGVH